MGHHLPKFIYLFQGAGEKVGHKALIYIYIPGCWGKSGTELGHNIYLFRGCWGKSGTALALIYLFQGAGEKVGQPLTQYIFIRGAGEKVGQYLALIYIFIPGCWGKSGTSGPDLFINSWVAGEKVGHLSLIYLFIQSAGEKVGHPLTQYIYLFLDAGEKVGQCRPQSKIFLI